MSDSFPTTPPPYSITAFATGNGTDDPIDNLAFTWTDSNGAQLVVILWGWGGNEIVYRIGQGNWTCQDGQSLVETQGCAKGVTPRHTANIRLAVDVGGAVTVYDGTEVLFSRTISQVQQASQIALTLENGELDDVEYHETLEDEFVMPWWGWLLIGIGIFLVVVIIGYALYKSSSSSKPPPAAPAPATTVTIQRPPPTVPGAWPAGLPPPPPPGTYNPYGPTYIYGTGGGATSAYTNLPTVPSAYSPPPTYLPPPAYPPPPGIYNPAQYQPPPAPRPGVVV